MKSWPLKTAHLFPADVVKCPWGYKEASGMQRNFGHKLDRL